MSATPRGEVGKRKVNSRLYKTNLCRTYSKQGSCPYGLKCQFAHGETELKVVPEDLEDKRVTAPTSVSGFNSPFTVSVLNAGVNNPITATPRARGTLSSPRTVSAAPTPIGYNSTIKNLGNSFSLLAMDSDDDEDESTVNSTANDVPGFKPLSFPTDGGSLPLLNIGATEPKPFISPRVTKMNLAASPLGFTPTPVDETRIEVDPRLYKTELCRSFSQVGECRYGEKCQFAHGIDELRPMTTRGGRDDSPKPQLSKRKELQSPRIMRLRIEDDAQLQKLPNTPSAVNDQVATLADPKLFKLDLNTPTSSPREAGSFAFSVPSTQDTFPSSTQRDMRVYKTELCKKFETLGACPYGFKCQFAHGEEELRVRTPATTTSDVFSTASFAEKQSTPSGSKTPKTGTPDPALYRTELCRSFTRSGYCRYGLKCQFAHGITQLRPTPKMITRIIPVDVAPLKEIQNDSEYKYSSPRPPLSGSAAVGRATVASAPPVAVSAFKLSIPLSPKTD